MKSSPINQLPKAVDRLTYRGPDIQICTYTAEKAALSEDSDPGAVRVVLFNALCPTPNGARIRAQKVTFILRMLPPMDYPSEKSL
jgi:hypothetical protein